VQGENGTRLAVGRLTCAAKFNLTVPKRRTKFMKKTSLIATGVFAVFVLAAKSPVWAACIMYEHADYKG